MNAAGWATVVGPALVGLLLLATVAAVAHFRQIGIPRDRVALYAYLVAGGLSGCNQIKGQVDATLLQGLPLPDAVVLLLVFLDAALAWPVYLL